ncbi:NAD(P)-dependent alcohol dehydrogenase [Nonomuraea soli]|uniref:NADPH:quinone reductase-like Zn-dependent oxidoreductase n=1 Tax=Nonomuraea soli TaxID=1032476 RepID=A0A7W0HRM2_9ACTN|nr:NAD(P)-dependent alcohol dehydrogenase [Nonomuraea soli]MBA2893139.1 NADPH:quinone reductase-like Zn-dependent oxidoreductase [Nonomuraea soli]
MKAITQRSYGPAETLTLDDIDPPTARDGEVLVRVHASSVNHADWATMTGVPYLSRLAFGLPGPRAKVRGRDLAGTVEAAGAGVTRFRPGDEVYGEAQSGSFAELVAVPEGRLAPKPARLTFEQAAAVPLAGYTALHCLRKGGITAGQHVLINGASGGVGTFAVQIAKATGAEVTGVCSTRNADLVTSLGADHVIDYTRENYTRGPRRYDLILDIAGNHPLSAQRRTLTPTGALVLSSATGGRLLGPMARVIGAVARNRFAGHTLLAPMAVLDAHGLHDLTELVEAGTVTPSIEQTYPLDETPDAMRHFGVRHARAKLVIAVSP